MQSSLEFFKNDTVIALLISILVFLFTIFLVVKNWIGFPITLLLLIFAITAGLAITNHQIIKCYVRDYGQPVTSEGNDTLFKKQVEQALQDVKMEVKSEKENLHSLMNQVNEMIEQMDKQKRKLQQFIEENKSHFDNDKSDKSDSKD